MRKYTADENEMKEYNGIVQRIARIQYEYDKAMQDLGAWEQAHCIEIPDEQADAPAEENPIQ